MCDDYKSLYEIGGIFFSTDQKYCPLNANFLY